MASQHGDSAEARRPAGRRGHGLGGGRGNRVHRGDRFVRESRPRRVAAAAPGGSARHGAHEQEEPGGAREQQGVAGVAQLGKEQRHGVTGQGAGLQARELGSCTGRGRKRLREQRGVQGSRW